MRVVTGQMTKRAMVTGRTLGRKQSRMEYLKNQPLLHLRLATLIGEYFSVAALVPSLSASVLSRCSESSTPFLRAAPSNTFFASDSLPWF